MERCRCKFATKCLAELDKDTHHSKYLGRHKRNGGFCCYPCTRMGRIYSTYSYRVGGNKLRIWVGIVELHTTGSDSRIIAYVDGG